MLPASYTGAATAIPAWLARRHGALAVGASFAVTVREWSDPGLLDRVMTGAGFAAVTVTPGRSGLVASAIRDRTLPDVVGPAMRALVCGLNPSLVAADAGFGYAGATNRFWPAALASGLVKVSRRPIEALASDRVGMTDLVKRATARSHHLDPGEYRTGADRVRRLVEWLTPEVVVFVGLEGWRAAVDRQAVPGWQPDGLGGAPAYLMPSTSGANAHVTAAELAAHLRTALAGPPART